MEQRKIKILNVKFWLRSPPGGGGGRGEGGSRFFLLPCNYHNFTKFLFILKSSFLKFLWNNLNMPPLQILTNIENLWRFINYMTTFLKQT